MEHKVINTIRTLAMDMTNNANSGHPGMPLGIAPTGYSIYKNMKINPKKPNWINRDRFVLAAGHATALLYPLLHLSGFKISLDDLKNFRQLHSNTPGHPENFMSEGVDATSGPLGQGLPTGVGMALAEEILAKKYNKPNYKVVDHYTYVLCSDGEMHEGVAFEASSLAGHWGLGKLIVFYDSNDITLDGPLNDSFSDDVKERYQSMNWQYILVEDGNDLDAINNALEMAKLDTKRPTLIEVKTIIGYGSSKQGSHKCHGAPLGKEDALNVKKFLGMPEAEFEIDNEIYDNFTYQKIVNGEKAYREWNKMFKAYQQEYPELAEEFINVIEEKYPIDFNDYKFKQKGDIQATRNSSLEVINYLADHYPTFLGGTADLSGSVMTTIKDSTLFSKNNISGRNINYGVREFAMGVINNGAMLHRGLKIFGGTFFVFSDYLKPAIRMSALSKIPAIYVFSHDSIAVGEDGPTHQPIEQLAMLRSIPNLNVIRPCDANEVVMAWDIAMKSQTTPTAIILTRQNLEVEANSLDANAYKGAYIIHKEQNDKIDFIIIATGSEVNLATKAAKELEKEGHSIRVVSMPSRNIFEKQSKKYQQEIIPNAIKKRLVIEMASPFGWHRYALKENQIFGIDTFGASGPGGEVVNDYGFNVENVVNKIKNIIK